MTEDQIRMITDSWMYVSKNPNLVTNFYNRLFEIAPETKRYFPQNLAKQSEKLAYTLNFLVLNLDRLSEIKGSIEDLGRHHNRMKIQPVYYTYVKKALVETIMEELEILTYGEEGVREAWDEALTFVSSVMVNAPEKREPRFARLFQKLKLLSGQK